MEGQPVPTRGRCINWMARRIRSDVLRMKDYEDCVKDRFFDGCEFFVEKPIQRK